MNLSIELGGAPVYAASGACYLCRTAPDGIWVRTQIDIEWEGEVCFCEGCASQIANLLNFISPAKADELRKSNRELGQKNKALQAKADAFDMFLSKTDEVREEIGAL